MSASSPRRARLSHVHEEANSPTDSKEKSGNHSIGGTAFLTQNQIIKLQDDINRLRQAIAWREKLRNELQQKLDSLNDLFDRLGGQAFIDTIVYAPLCGSFQSISNIRTFYRLLRIKSEIERLRNEIADLVGDIAVIRAVILDDLMFLLVPAVLQNVNAWR